MRAFRSREAVAIAGGRFTAVGTSDAIQKLAGPKTTTIDLHGQTVIPGLADGHLHDAGGGPGVDLSSARSLADIARRRRGAREAGAGPATSSSRTATGTRRS